MKEPTLNSTPSGATPGTLLKAVRQEKGISVVDVAARLCLSAQFIEDIEHDDYSRMSARAYARGYIMSYAQLLGIPQSQILPTLSNVSMDFAPPKNTLKLDERSNPVYQPVESHRQHSNVMLWISIFVIIILIGLVVMWWKGPSAPTGKTDTNTSTLVPIQPQSPAPTPPSSAAPVTAPAPAPASTTTPTSAPVTLPAPVSTATPARTPRVAAQSAQSSGNTPAPVVKAEPARPAAPSAPQAANDQSVMQPSDLKDSGRTRSSAGMQLPAPRASSDD